MKEKFLEHKDPFIIRKKNSNDRRTTKTLRRSSMDRMSKNILSQKNWNESDILGEIRMSNEIEHAPDKDRKTMARLRKI